MKRYKIVLFRIASWLATRKKIPWKFSDGAINEVRFSFVHFSISFDEEGCKSSFLVTSSASKFGLCGHFFDRNNNLMWTEIVEAWDQPSACLPFALVKSYEIKLEEVHGRVNIEHTSFWKFFASRITFGVRRKLYRMRREFRKFNKNFHFSAEATKILRDIMTIQEGRAVSGTPHFKMSSAFSSVDMFTQIHSIYVCEREDFNYLHDKFHFALESLVSSGELERREQNYSLSPKALQTVIQFEQSQKRTLENDRLNRLTRWLTFATAMAAIVQAVPVLKNDVLPEVSSKIVCPFSNYIGLFRCTQGAAPESEQIPRASVQDHP